MACEAQLISIVILTVCCRKSNRNPYRLYSAGIRQTRSFSFRSGSASSAVTVAILLSRCNLFLLKAGKAKTSEKKQ